MYIRLLPLDCFYLFWLIIHHPFDTEFLLESAFLCIIGGIVGLFLVWLLTLILSASMPFPIFISSSIIGLALSICIVLGVLSGIIPAAIAAKMDPVVAIRTK